MSGYECSKCHLAVIVPRDGGKPIKACACAAPIAMSMTSAITAAGGVKA
jgi:hypothetical protein